MSDTTVSEPEISSSQAAGTRLEERIPIVMERWEAKVRAVLPAARDEGAAALRNSLPLFLRNLAQLLARGGLPASPPESNTCEEHGKQRAALTSYTLGQVLAEYRLLRETIVETLEEDIRLSASDERLIFTCVEQAIQEAAEEFTRLTREYEEERLQRAQQAQQFAESVVETVGKPLVVLDGDLRVVFANRAFYLAFRAAAEDTVGRLIYDLSGGQWNLPELRTLLEEVLPKGTLFQDFAVEQEFAGLGRRSLLLNGRTLYRPGSDSEMILLAIEDVTEQVQAAELLRRQEAQSRRLAEQLSEADQQKNDFLAMLAHELRTPLGAISNSLFVLQSLNFTEERAQRQIQAATRQTRHLARLVEDLLDVSRVSRGKVELRTEPTDLGKVIHSAAEATRPLMEGKAHRLTLSLPPQVLCVEADAVRLEQVFTNLLNNAAKYSQDGSAVNVCARAEGREAVVSIRDTGMGISPDLLPRIFEPFVQADDSVTRTKGGLGIGLTLVRSLVELHGGSITAHSDGLGTGSEFVVRMPLIGIPQGSSS